MALQVSKVFAVKRFESEHISDFFPKVSKVFAKRLLTWNKTLTFHPRPGVSIYPP